MTRLRVILRFSGAILASVLAALGALAARAVSVGSAKLGARLGSRVCAAWSWSMLAVLGVRREATGRPPGGVFVVASNHLSYLDIWVLSTCYRSIFVAKQEIASWPVVGFAIRAAGTIFVDRRRPRKMVQAGRTMSALLEAGIPLTLFAEGTTTSGREILPFLPSLLEPAARAGVPCYAVALSYETPGVSAPPSDSVCWHDATPFLRHFTRLLRVPRTKARVTFCPVPVSSADRKALARDLWEQACRVFVPVRHEAQP